MSRKYNGFGYRALQSQNKQLFNSLSLAEQSYVKRNNHYRNTGWDNVIYTYCFLTLECKSFDELSDDFIKDAVNLVGFKVWSDAKDALFNIRIESLFFQTNKALDDASERNLQETLAELGIDDISPRSKTISRKDALNCLDQLESQLDQSIAAALV